MWPKIECEILLYPPIYERTKKKAKTIGKKEG